VGRVIDVHTHILPGLDDGARTLEESVAMASHADVSDDASSRLIAHSPPTCRVLFGRSASWSSIHGFACLSGQQKESDPAFKP